MITLPPSFPSSPSYGYYTPERLDEAAQAAKTSQVAASVFNQGEAPMDIETLPSTALQEQVGMDIESPVSQETPSPFSEAELHEMVSDANFIARIRVLVSKLLTQLNHISENDRKQLEKLKLEYRTAAEGGALMQNKMGTLAPWAAAASLALAIAPIGYEFVNGPMSQNGTELLKVLGNHLIPNGKEWMTSNYQAQQMKHISNRDLTNLIIGQKTSKSQSESGSKNELLQLLNSAFEVLKRSTQ